MLPTKIEIGEYNLIKPLGKGGFGTTYLAEKFDEYNSKYALKKLTFSSNKQSEFDTAKKLFEREIKTLKKLNGYEHIPKFYGEYEYNQELYLVQELIEGKTLSDELKEYGKFDEDKVINLLKEILEILVFIHKNKIIHRDIKPDNIMRRSNNNKLVLIDFGSVKWNPQTNLKIPATGVYTPNYAPFEQIKGKPQFNSDIYALGITAIQCLTNQLLSEEEEIINYLQKSQISTKLQLILMTMIEHNYKERYQSAQEVLDCFPSSQVTPEEEIDTIVIIPPSPYYNADFSQINEEVETKPTIFVPIPIIKNSFTNNKFDFLINIMFILIGVFSIFFILEASGNFNNKKAPPKETKQSLSLKYYTINNIF